MEGESTSIAVVHRPFSAMIGELHTIFPSITTYTHLSASATRQLEDPHYHHHDIL